MPLTRSDKTCELIRKVPGLSRLLPLYCYTQIQMSQDQLNALLAKVKDDAAFRDKLQGLDLDGAVALVKSEGFDVSKADWMKYQAQQTLELSDEDLESAAGGKCAGQTKTAVNCSLINC